MAAREYDVEVKWVQSEVMCSSFVVVTLCCTNFSIRSLIVATIAWSPIRHSDLSCLRSLATSCMRHR
jgi:hypothetical protein